MDGMLWAVVVELLFCHSVNGVGEHLFIDPNVKFSRDTGLPESFKMQKSGRLQIMIEQLGGAMSRMPPSSAVWKHHSAQVMISIQAFVDDLVHLPTHGTEEYFQNLDHLNNWTKGFFDELHEYSAGCYANYADTDLANWQEDYYGSEIYSRLVDIKGQISGGHIFRGKQRIEHAGKWTASVVMHDMTHKWHNGVTSSLDPANVHGGWAIDKDYSPNKRPDEDVVEYVDDWDAEGNSTELNLPGILGDVPTKSTSTASEERGAAQAVELPDWTGSMAAGVKLRHSDSTMCPSWLLETMLPSDTEGVVNDEGHEQADSVIGENLASGSGRSLSADSVSSTNGQPSMKRKQYLLTGGSGGIGRSAVLHLARLGSDVIFTSTTKEGCVNAEHGMTAILDGYNDTGLVVCGILQLDNLQSVRDFVSWVSNVSWARNGYERLDGIILNVGYFSEFRVAPDAGGVSMSFAVNHLGHFLLTHLLVVGGILNPASGRIIVQSSFAAYVARASDIDAYMAVPPEPYDPPDPNLPILSSKQFIAYASGKAVNLLYAIELQRRLHEASGIRVYVALPVSTVATDMTSSLLENPQWAKEILLRGSVGVVSTAEAALPCVYLASADSFPESNGPVLASSCRIVQKDVFPIVHESSILGCHLWKRSMSIAGLSYPSEGTDMENALLASCDE